MEEERAEFTGKRFLCSWSGGKDSLLAMERAIAAGGAPAALLTMCDDRRELTRNHGIPVDVIAEQARLLGVELVTARSGWDDYREVFSGALAGLRSRGVADAVFGDIDIAEHRDWNEAVCAEARVSAHLPLWGAGREALLREFSRGGHSALVVTVQTDRLPADVLGRVLDEETLEIIREHGVDPCGEAGEYHTLVVDGPHFSSPLQVRSNGTTVHDGYGFLELLLDRGRRR